MAERILEKLPYQVGSLVRAHKRDLVVLPSDDPEILHLPGFSGSESEVYHVDLGLTRDSVKPAEFSVPEPGTAAEKKKGTVPFFSDPKENTEAYCCAAYLLRRVTNMSLREVAALFAVSVSRISHIQRRMETKQLSAQELEAIRLCKVKQ